MGLPAASARDRMAGGRSVARGNRRPLHGRSLWPHPGKGWALQRSIRHQAKAVCPIQRRRPEPLIKSMTCAAELVRLVFWFVALVYCAWARAKTRKVRCQHAQLPASKRLIQTIYRGFERFTPVVAKPQRRA